MKSFWQFNPWEKWDEIKEGRHDHLYYGALADRETGIEKIDHNTYILYGTVEALLMRPSRKIFILGLELLNAFLEVLYHDRS